MRGSDQEVLDRHADARDDERFIIRLTRMGDERYINSSSPSAAQESDEEGERLTAN